MLTAFEGLGLFNQWTVKKEEHEVFVRRIEFYWSKLDDLEWTDVAVGLDRACRYVTHGFPYPGVIREHAERARDERRAMERQQRQLALPPGRNTQEDAAALVVMRDALGRLWSDWSSAPTDDQPLH
jgi:hypothetical protein